MVEDLSCAFAFWVIELEPEYFMRRLSLEHKHWILSRIGVVKEPKEKWRYLMATFERGLSRLGEVKWQQVVEQARKEAKPEELEDPEKELRKAIQELQAFDRKVKLFRIAQKIEQGETNFKVYQGLLPGESYETLEAKMQEAFELMAKQVPSA